ncbi:hypothetical protein LNP17_18130 [Klebsiella variicola subsp. variicola]|nr:hypothetical protein [Klebsiella variicola subsp. variicola]
MTDEFGWSRRNAFIQPQVDAVMYNGLQRFPAGPLPLLPRSRSLLARTVTVSR